VLKTFLLLLSYPHGAKTWSLKTFWHLLPNEVAAKTSFISSPHYHVVTKTIPSPVLNMRPQTDFFITSLQDHQSPKNFPSPLFLNVFQNGKTSRCYEGYS
jgi:hypothetical protein